MAINLPTLRGHQRLAAIPLSTSAKENAVETLGILFPRDLDIWIHKIIQWLSILLRTQFQVPPRAELHAIGVVSTEEIVSLFRMLPGFGNIYRNPSVLGFEEICPAMVASDFC